MKVGKRGIKTLYEDAFKKEIRLKKLQEKIDLEAYHEANTATESSNKYLMNKFIQQYNNAKYNILPDDKQDKVNLYQLNQFFESMKLVPLPEEIRHTENAKDKREKEEEEPNFDVTNLKDTTFRQQEKQLLTQIWEELKDVEGNIWNNQLFVFILSILNLYESYQYSMYKQAHKEDLKQEEKEKIKEQEKAKSKKKSLEKPERKQNDSTKKTSPKEKPNEAILAEGEVKGEVGAILAEGEVLDFNNTDINMDTRPQTQGNLHKSMKEEKSKKEIEKELILKKVQEEFTKKVKTSKKYTSLDNDNEFFINFNNSKAINKDFNVFYVNWSNHMFSQMKQTKLEEAEKNMMTSTFKPKINDNSAKIFNEYRKKVHTNSNKSY